MHQAIKSSTLFLVVQFDSVNTLVHLLICYPRNNYWRITSKSYCCLVWWYHQIPKNNAKVSIRLSFETMLINGFARCNEFSAIRPRSFVQQSDCRPPVLCLKLIKFLKRSTSIATESTFHCQTKLINFLLDFASRPDQTGCGSEAIKVCFNEHQQQSVALCVFEFEFGNSSN